MSTVSTLPELCLEEIFECLLANKSSLVSSLLVNRHWCKTALRLLWRNPLLVQTKKGLGRQLVILCLPAEHPLRAFPLFQQLETTFPYTTMMKSLDLPLLCETIEDEYIFTETPIIYVVTAILEKLLIDGGTVFFDLNLDFIAASRRLAKSSCENQSFTYNQFKIFNHPEVKNSLAMLRRLTISNLRADKIVPLIAKTSPNITELHIHLYSEYSEFTAFWGGFICTLSSLNFLLPYLQGWRNLSVLSFAYGDVPPTREIREDYFLVELGRNLPPTKIRDLIFDVYFDVMPNSIKQFFDVTRASFQKISFLKTIHFSDEHLNMIALNSCGKLFELDISGANHVTNEGLIKAKKSIPRIYQ
ncbi:6232_t:CDS:1 [Ambispora gerdemannii]|uniref:6232_t:CDS:1 n=1 Tax=Ambispora gerdemannii TaxID=144530 RepID=A0A9N9ANL5_9GLOM|nr:6232_t:CDS:1 [Ambispora gerdemannii]